ncbi:hypothetical protein [Novipirellula sp.]|uniref:hypothetical protein n=1 Tax=Novipirellula sp. TaxID=2795430 RepID=UPI0035694D8A
MNAEPPTARFLMENQSRRPGYAGRYVPGDSSVLGQFLDQIRDYYVSRFIDAINEHSGTDGVTVTHEPAFCNADGDVVTEGELALPSRGDLLVIRNGAVSDSLRIDTEGMLSFESIAFDWPANRLNVDLRPFQWNWMQLRIFGLKTNADWTPIRDWFIRWFQEKDPADDELLGGVHFLSDPEDGHDYSQVSIDLGTAPVKSFEELLDALGQLGADRVQIGQFNEGT